MGKADRMIEADRVLLLVGVSIVALGLSSRLVKRHALSPVVLAMGVGVLVGPHALDLIDPTAAVPRGELLEQLCRVALALAVFDIALRTRPADLRANARRVGALLLVVMPGMWLLTSIGAGLLLDLSFPVALLLGAALTPTDPGVAAALVSGILPDQSLPRRVRRTLQLEAAANDGLALPFVLFAGLIATLPAGEALPEWGIHAAREIGVAALVGALVGGALRWLTKLADVDRLAEEDWYPLASTGVAVTVLALAHLLGGSGVFAAFVAGMVFCEGLPEGLREPIHEVHRSITKVALSVAFLGFGMTLPVDRWWPEVGAAGVAFAAWVFFLRRAPVAVPTMLLTGTGRLSSMYIGWSGPLGVAGIYYLTYAERYLLPEYEGLFLAGTLAITVSVLGHALTSSVAVHTYRRMTGCETPEGEELQVEGALP
ncbi:MAG: cation:proton antiporter [Acidimicrobiia bacterium]